MTACDLIITVDQTLVHQAGSMGHPCWTMLPRKADWRYHPTGEMTRWYPNGDLMRVYRQGEDAQWEPVIKRLEKEFSSWLQLQGADLFKVEVA